MSNYGCVYFVKHISGKPIKIGFTKDETPEKRMKQLSVSFPSGIELIGSIRTENAKELELKLHEKLSGFRLEGEWFFVSVPLIKKIIRYYNAETPEERELVLIEHKIDLDRFYSDDKHFCQVFSWLVHFDCLENPTEETICSSQELKSSLNVFLSERDELLANLKIDIE